MSLDGILLAHLRKEIALETINSRIEKIFQPAKYELTLHLKSSLKKNILLFSANPMSARVHLIKEKIENPEVPPMFCMLMRKKLEGAKLVSIDQKGLDRTLRFEFCKKNELGDEETLKLIIEIMGKHSNIILVNSCGIIIDAIKRVDENMSSKRLVLPNIKYEFPPSQNKLCLLSESPEKIESCVQEKLKFFELEKSLLDSIEGLSPLICKEFSDKDKISNIIKKLYSMASDLSCKPIMILKNGSPIDFSFFVPKAYQNSYKEYDSFSELIDSFFSEKDSLNRIKSKYSDLFKKITNIYNRCKRKISIRKKELALSEEKEKFKIFADIINANLYNLKQKQSKVKLANFYEGNSPLIEIPLDIRFTPAQNAERYYKKYKKLKSAENILTQEISNAQKEYEYLETVLYELERATNEEAINDIKEELVLGGYIKEKRKNKIKTKSIPLEYTSSEGFKILVGKNNKQNDNLTLKKSNKNDLWFHVQGAPGSHVLIKTEGKIPPENTIIEAALFAAKHSKLSQSSRVLVDYTLVKNVTKPAGSKPGFVIYKNFKTLSVNPFSKNF